MTANRKSVTCPPEKWRAQKIIKLDLVRGKTEIRTVLTGHPQAGQLQVDKVFRSISLTPGDGNGHQILISGNCHWCQITMQKLAWRELKSAAWDLPVKDRVLIKTVQTMKYLQSGKLYSKVGKDHECTHVYRR